ncbi:MAG: hypothetical protein RIC03_02455 [Cyclobacteriaceae bacterium]
MKIHWFFVGVVCLLASCSDPFVPQGLYDYQVERLITNDTSKSWVLRSLTVDGQNVEVMACDENITFLAETITADSLVFLEINKQADCSANDTLFWGSFRASGHIRNIFRDSLYFDDGIKPSFGLVEVVTPESLIISFSEGAFSERYSLSSN